MMDKIALYIAGMIRGIEGIFCSNQTGRSWARIDDGKYRRRFMLQTLAPPGKWAHVPARKLARCFYGDIALYK
jgi:hypothetical protein